MEKMQDLRLTLRDLGFTSRAGRGSHEVWTDPVQPRRRVVLYGRDSHDAPRYQAHRVRRFRKGMMVYQQEGQ